MLAAGAVSAMAHGADERIVRVDNGLSLGFRFEQFSYVEPSDTCGLGVCTNAASAGYLDRESGGLPGFRLAFSHLGSADGLYERLAYAMTAGNVRYDGFSSSGAPIINGSSYARIQDYSLRFGAAFPRAGVIAVPFAQIGRHTWTRIVGAGTPSHYEEYYDHAYASLGALVQVVLPAGMVGSLYADAGEIFAAHIAVPGEGFSADLGGGPLVKAGALLDLRVTRRIGLYAGIRYTRYGYGQSAVTTIGNYVIMEPESRTILTRYEGGLRYAFF